MYEQAWREYFHPRPARRRFFSKRALSKCFHILGGLLMIFAVYRLWGTGLTEARGQEQLKRSFEAGQSRPIKGGLAVSAVPMDSSPPPAPIGDAVAIIKIPKIEVEKTVVEGTRAQDLAKGPGHYLGTPMPGEAGNAAIAGHRTTYGAPFFHLDQLVAGDPILVTTRKGTFRYEVTQQTIITPTDSRVFNPSPDNRLTLTTCHPPLSAARRMVVIAVLKGSPAGE